MSDKHWLGRRWKLILNLVTLGALVILIYAIRHQLEATFRDLAHVHGWALLLLIPVEILNYHAQTRLYQRLFAIVGNRLSYKHLYRTSLELNFVNHVFPSGGVTGLSYFTLRLRSGKQLTGAKATLVHVLKIGLYIITFEILLVFGVLSLAVMGRVNNLVMLVAGSLMTILLLCTAGFAYIIGSKQRINAFFLAATKGLNRLIQVVRPSYPETINIDKARGVFEDFHDNYQAIRGSSRQLKAPFWYALLADVTEVMAVYVVYIAFGKLVNVGAVILAYGIANVAGLISVLPGGVGIYEALMTGVLASTGVPPAISLPVTVMYRVLNTLIQIPPGYYLYQRTLRQSDRPEETNHA
jgi:putative heme transporter